MHQNKNGGINNYKIMSPPVTCDDWYINRVFISNTIHLSKVNVSNFKFGFTTAPNTKQYGNATPMCGNHELICKIKMLDNYHCLTYDHNGWSNAEAFPSIQCKSINLLLMFRNLYEYSVRRIVVSTQTIRL